MPTSELIHLLHWVVYIGSVLALVLLFTRFRKWGALWTGILFASQALFNGCLIVAWQNYYRAKEGLLPLQPELLTDRFSPHHSVQIILSILIALIAFAIVALEFIET